MKNLIIINIFFSILTIDQVQAQLLGNGECISVKATAMNILYIGVDNPVEIKSRFISDSITVSGCGIKKFGENNYIASPKIPGLDKMKVVLHNGKDSL